MKAAVVLVLVLAVMPALAMLAYSSALVRTWLTFAAIFLTCFGESVGTILGFFQYRGIDRGWDVNLADVCTWALMFALLLRFPGRVKWLPYGFTVLLALFVVGIVSAVTAMQPNLAVYSLWKAFKWFLVYWTMTNAFRTGVSLDAFWNAVIVIAFLMAFTAFKQRYVDHIIQVPCFFPHRNTIPCYLYALIPTTLLAALTDRSLSRRRAWLMVFACLAMCGTIVVTLSRAALAFTPLMLVGALAIANLRQPSRRSFAVTVAFMACTFVAALLAADSILERFEKAPESSKGAREEFEEAARLMIADHPLTGVGLNNYPYVLSNVEKYRGHLWFLRWEKQSGNAHHIYLLVTAETGYPGVILLLLMIARFLWLQAWNGFRSRTGEGYLLLGFFMGGVALHLNGTLEYMFKSHPVASMYFITCAVSWNLSQRIRARRASTAASARVVPAVRPRVLPAAAMR